ncbi:tyrosine-type recombinase/integrase [Phototrophicus methaneseepsis]
MATSYSPATKKNFGIFLRQTMTSYFSAMRPLTDFTHSDLVRFISYCENERGVSRASLRQYTAFLRAFFKWCNQSGYTEVDPAKSLMSPKVTQRPDPVRGIPTHHLRKMLDYTEQCNLRNYALLLFMSVTGCRVSAASKLEWSRLNLETYRAQVFEKGQRWVYYEFDSYTADVLAHWLQSRPAVDHDYVWTSERQPYGPIKPASIRQMLQKVCDHLKIPRYTPHQIRHSVGEMLASHYHSELAVASALNHQDLKSARHYMPRRLQETYQLRQEIVATIYPDRECGPTIEGRKTIVPYLRIVD